MAYVTMTADHEGTVYTIDYNGNVYRNPRGGFPGRPLEFSGFGQLVTSGWSGVRHLVVGQLSTGTLLVGIDATSKAVFGVVPPGSSATVAPRAISQEVLPLGQLFIDRSQTLYLVTLTGALLKQPVAVGPADQPPFGPAELVANRWWSGGFTLFASADGVLFQVDASGVLQYQLIGAAGVTPGGSWVALPGAWSRYLHVFGGEPGTINLIRAEGQLARCTYSITPSHTVELQSVVPVPTGISGMFPWTGLPCSVEAYAWPRSVTAGETVCVHTGVRLSTPPAGAWTLVPDSGPHLADVVRLHRMKNGVEDDYDVVHADAAPSGLLHAAQTPAPADLLTKGAGWPVGFTVTVPDVPPTDPKAWSPGVYAARLTDMFGYRFYAPFIVRPAPGAPRAPFAMLANTNTWNAYNSWGGQGKYTKTHPLPGTLPFLRPHPGLTPEVTWQNLMAGTRPLMDPEIHSNGCHLLRAELWIQGWLDDLLPAYPYDVYTDQDLHEGRTGIGDGDTPAYKGLILNTHPEYWTREMYDRVMAYVRQGGSIIYLGGNGIYEEVVLSDDGAHMKIFPGVDLAAYPRETTNEQIRLSCLMRSPGAGRPESAILGVGFVHVETSVEGQPYVLGQDPKAEGSNPVLAGLPLQMGAELGVTSHNANLPSAGDPGVYHVNGWEVDCRGGGTPPQAFEASALIGYGADGWQSGEMICYRSTWGGVVFSASSLNFGGSLVVDPNLQQIVKNALDLALKGWPPDHRSAP